jgi:hypothetical protein
MLACLSDDVAHDINQGERQVGKDTFRAFIAHMERCYRERLDGIVLMANEDGTRGGGIRGAWGIPRHGRGCPKRMARLMCCRRVLSSPSPMAGSRG